MLTREGEVTSGVAQNSRIETGRNDPDRECWEYSLLLSSAKPDYLWNSKI